MSPFQETPCREAEFGHFVIVVAPEDWPSSAVMVQDAALAAQTSLQFRPVHSCPLRLPGIGELFRQFLSRLIESISGVFSMFKCLVQRFGLGSAPAIRWRLGGINQ